MFFLCIFLRFSVFVEDFCHIYFCHISFLVQDFPHFCFFFTFSFWFRILLIFAFFSCSLFGSRFSWYFFFFIFLFWLKIFLVFLLYIFLAFSYLSLGILFQLMTFFSFSHISMHFSWCFLCFQCILVLKTLLGSRELSGSLSNILILHNFPMTTPNQISTKLTFWLTFFQFYLCYVSQIEINHWFPQVNLKCSSCSSCVYLLTITHNFSNKNKIYPGSDLSYSIIEKFYIYCWIFNKKTPVASLSSQWEI